MSKTDLQNKNLDRIERRLLETAKVSSEEFDRIVAAPRLFQAIKAGIEKEKQTRRAPQRFFAGWINISFLNRQTIAGAMAILLVSAVCAAVVIFRKQESPQLVTQAIEKETKALIAPGERREQLAEIEATEISADKKRVRTERLVHKVKKQKAPRRETKPNQPKAPRSFEKQSPQVFYSLARGANWEAENEELQVVRAELSRSDLFSLGVNLPDEEGVAKIKTDLLVGSNGVPRAIRFVE
jgi:hypothetical protein